MFKDTRWLKVLSDIWENKARTILVVVSIAVGVFAVGMVANARIILMRDLSGNWERSNPSSAIMRTSPFQEDLEYAVEGTREIAQAEARRTQIAKVVYPDGSTDEILLVVAPDYNNMRVDQLNVEQGMLNPGLRGLNLERMAVQDLGLEYGQEVTIEMRNEDTYQLMVTGIVHDMQAFPPWFGNTAQGYITMETLEWMGEDAYYDELRVIVAENEEDKQHVINVLTDVRDRVMEPEGIVVGNLGLADSEPGEHWATDENATMILILSLMGLMSLILSGGLVSNTVAAILTQQIKQIGIMRSVGAPSRQISGMYLSSILIFSLLALFISVPLGILGALGLSNWIAGLLNFNVESVGLPPAVLAIQTGVGVAVPIFASLIPISRGMNISVYDAIYQQASDGVEKEDPINKLLKRLRDIPRPLILSLRNTFRNKKRLISTITTLTLAGMTFIGVVTTRSSLLNTLDAIMQYYAFDVAVALPSDTDGTYIAREAERLDGILIAEGWVITNDASIVWADDSESEEILVFAPPENAITFTPLVLEGRFITPGEDDTVVINAELASSYPNVQVGDELELNLSGNDRKFTVVGLISSQLSGSGVYMNLDTYTQATNTPGNINELRLRASPGSLTTNFSQDQMSAAMEDRLENLGISTGVPQTNHELTTGIAGSFDIIVSFLMVMAVLLAVVGGLGLAGTMSLNVLERFREIGVLRAVGASNKSVRRVVVLEGLFIGLISWILGVILAVPFGYVFSNVVGVAFLSMPLEFKFSFVGVFIWLGLIVAIAVAASLAPAQRASSVTIREVLSTE